MWPSLRGEEEKRERFQAILHSDLLTVCIVFQDYIVADVAITEGEEEKRERFRASFQSVLITFHFVSGLHSGRGGHH
jgi:hypothetical protein